MTTKTKITVTLDKHVLEQLRLTARADSRSASGYIEMLAKAHFQRMAESDLAVLEARRPAVCAPPRSLRKSSLPSA